eukprot:CAMPEP_0206046084 /NCGR_PEP_ID=MMETSP1466-20131121/17689_1 /ASSEMBLY_ACC=CAM_ASM_001126 /TAXON_ID=44452 /ORGANISM="Pavlova gyrans, Strain CCMP608" /LENGTH=31 /DNA_ID= /DNA_START= /DNA_END= /DNA_ORIENTATION=
MDDGQAGKKIAIGDWSSKEIADYLTNNLVST